MKWINILKGKVINRARIESGDKQENKTFKTLDEAIEWRRNKEIEYFGQHTKSYKEKKDRQI